MKVPGFFFGRACITLRSVLFNSYEFIFLFLPVILCLYFLARRMQKIPIIYFTLLAGSLSFYAYWEPRYLILISGSILFNYYLGFSISQKTKKSGKVLLVLGVAANLGLLGFFKYFSFTTGLLNFATGLSLPTPQIILPLAISFFTFQQISYLVDSYKGVVSEHNFLRYALFVTFFPQLIAGPIVHHAEMMPQFDKILKKQNFAENFSVGATLFFIGLFKKVIFADSIAPYANATFYSAISNDT